MKKFVQRVYQSLIEQHFKKNRQMLFLMGPRQVGKTTLGLNIAKQLKADFIYLNWDNLDHRELLLQGPRAIADLINVNLMRKHPPLVVFDEIHKYKEWKNLVKGFFDTYAHSGEIRIIVTGSARLDVYNSSGDSMMGRYFRFRVHPFSVAELIGKSNSVELWQMPSLLAKTKFENLYKYGGFPEPLIKADLNFYTTWKELRLQQLFYEEIRDISRIHEIKQMELLALHLRNQVGSLTSYTSYANKIRVTVETIRRWIDTLSQLYYCFIVKPWSKNVTRSLLKEPKFYLWDWSLIDDIGARAENFVAAHLLKACHYWVDRGLGQFELYFLRDKEKREVDFLVTKNNKAWFIVEVKNSIGPLSPSLAYFKNETKAEHAFQVTLEAEHVNVNCFECTTPVIVPAKTFLSQLV